MARLLPTSVQTFETLRDKGMVYIDKTAYIEKLRKKSREIFLSRPRRFGKSLFTSTLEAYFLGKKELFTGLEISEIEEKKGGGAWKTYPVIPFYLASGEFNSRIGLEDKLGAILDSCADRYGLTGEYSVTGDTVSVRFFNLIEKLYQKTQSHTTSLYGNLHIQKQSSGSPSYNKSQQMYCHERISYLSPEYLLQYNFYIHRKSTAAFPHDIHPPIPENKPCRK